MKKERIESRILRTEDVEWKKLEWLQGGLKQISDQSMGRLKESLRKNGFVAPFHVWEDKKRGWILDGHRRKRAMEELGADGVDIPDKLPANFIRCESRKQAMKMILVYSSIYARSSDEGLMGFVSSASLDFDLLRREIDIPYIDYGNIEQKIQNAKEGEEIEIPRSVQLVPPMEYVLIMCEPNSEEWEGLKQRLDLKMVRRGGYKKNSVFDDVMIERVLKVKDFTRRFDAGRNRK